MSARKTKATLPTSATSGLEPLRARVQRRREYLALLEVELTNTRAIVQEFTQLYNERITPLELQQARLRKLLDELTADLAPPPNGWRGRDRRKEPSAAAESNGQNESEPGPKEKPAAARDVDYERKVRDLFRRLAKQYHPDLAQDEDEKQRHAQIMSEINQAYMAKDLDALETLATSQAGPETYSNLPEAELARLSVELRQLDEQVFEVEQTIRELDLSPAMQMYSDSRGERGGRGDLLSEMEAEYRGRIGDLREELMGMGVEIEIGD
ncbi:MAG TPA: J domain-containing protein [Anaerolineales bacterium]|nr:J domain-containing protein [Anaerolineales bacterium]